MRLTSYKIQDGHHIKKKIVDKFEKKINNVYFTMYLIITESFNSQS